MIGSGSLAERDFADIVKVMSARRFSGRLVLERDGVRVLIHLVEGRVVFASSSEPDHRLGPLLLRRGTISLVQMEDAGRGMIAGKRFGTVLVERGYLSREDLVRGVVDQTRDIVLQVFRWTSGDYRAEEGKGPGESIMLDIGTPQLIFEGMAQIDAWSRVERGCGGLGAHYAPAPGGEALFRQLTLDVDHAQLLRSIKGEHTLEALCAGSALSDFDVCRALWAFRVIGLVRHVEHATLLDEDGLEYVLPPEDPEEAR